MSHTTSGVSMMRPGRRQPLVRKKGRRVQLTQAVRGCRKQPLSARQFHLKGGHGGKSTHDGRQRYTSVQPQACACQPSAERALRHRAGQGAVAHAAAHMQRLGARRPAIGSLPGPSRPNKPLQQQEDANVAQRCERTVRRVDCHSFCVELARRSVDALVDFCVCGRMPSCGTGTRTRHAQATAGQRRRRWAVQASSLRDSTCPTVRTSGETEQGFGGSRHGREQRGRW